MQVFKAVAELEVASESGHKAWHDCMDVGKLDGTDPIPLLDTELAVQTGNDTESTVAILPTVRVNQKQYRGTLDAPSVIRALCAAFPLGQEPSLCNEGWVSDNECAIGGAGWKACNEG